MSRTLADAPGHCARRQSQFGIYLAWYAGSVDWPSCVACARRRSQLPAADVKRCYGRSRANLPKASYEAGTTADVPPDTFEMMEFEQQYIFGFITGYSVAVSVRAALPAAARWTAGELGRQYGIPLDTLLKEVQFEIDEVMLSARGMLIQSFSL